MYRKKMAEQGSKEGKESGEGGGVWDSNGRKGIVLRKKCFGLV
jgi:hypothetical protein